MDELTLRDRMGGGNFGQVYEGITNPPGKGLQPSAAVYVHHRGGTAWAAAALGKCA